MTQTFYDRVAGELTDIEAQGLTKPERVIASRQGPMIQVAGRDVLNFCANNYLGLAGDARVAEAGIAAQQKWGAGTASVRFICGTLEIHKELEAAIAGYLGFEDAILFAAAFDANGGLFEPLLGENDAIVSDSLNHASIIDGVRLCKAKRYRFANSDMDELEARLKVARAAGARDIIIATDGAFSMDGYIAKLDEIRALADKYDALIMVDDCHATGFLGSQGKGSFAHHGVEVDFVTGTFGKALGGAMGGFICARKSVVELLKVLLKAKSDNAGVASKLIATVADLEKIAISDDADIDAMKGWRRQIFGEDALKLKRGEIALVLNGARVEVVEIE